MKFNQLMQVMVRRIAALMMALTSIGLIAASPALAQGYLWPVQQQTADRDPQYKALLEERQQAEQSADAGADDYSPWLKGQQRLIAYVEATYGERSEIFAHEYQAYLLQLESERISEARIGYPRLIRILRETKGRTSEEFRSAHFPYARVLRVTGYISEAAEAQLIAFEGQLEDVLDCGRKIGGNMISGCNNTEPLFSSLFSAAIRAHKNAGRADDIPGFIDGILPQFEEKWNECDGPRWQYDCEDVPLYREAIEEVVADYYLTVDREDEAIAIRERHVVAKLDRLVACRAAGGDLCREHDAWYAWGDLDRALERAGQNDRRMVLFETVLGTYAEDITGYLNPVDPETAEEMPDRYTWAIEGYVELASAAGQIDTMQAALERLGLSAMAAPMLRERTAGVRLAELNELRLSLSDYSDEKIAVLREALALSTEIYGEGSHEWFGAARNLFWALQYQDKLGLYREEVEQSLEVAIRTLGYGSNRTHHLLMEQTEILEDAGEREAAIALLTLAMEDAANQHDDLFADLPAFRRANSFFMNNFDLHSELNHRLARFSLELDRPTRAALVAARRSIASHRAFAASLKHDDSGQRAYDDAINGDAFDRLLNRDGTPLRKYQVLTDLLWETSEDRDAVTEEAFRAAQDAMTSRVTLAIGQEAAQRLVQSAGMQDLLDQREEALTAAVTGNDYNAMARARDRQALADLELRRMAPGYFDFIRPVALEVGEVQALLGKDEAVVLLFPGPRGTHVFAVTRTAIQWHRSDLIDEDIDDYVKLLRADLDPAGAGLPEPWVYTYDRYSAFDLYQQLLGPVEDTLGRSRVVYFASSGSLATLPPSVLVISEPEGLDDDLDALRETRWLVDRYAPVQLPSIQSLRFLRVQERIEAGERQEFIGFGDPILLGESATRGRVSGNRITMGGSLFRGSMADVGEIRNLARIRGTARELKSIAQILGTDAGDLFLGEAATEDRVKAMDFTGARIVAFATHGLLAGEVGGQLEPGLVFTPPDTASEANDGLLTASEIIALRFEADWILLSACNTAAGDDVSSEGLAGLAKAFFFAGARSLLASHWLVRDDLAAELTANAVAMHATGKERRAIALQKSMIAIRNDQSDPTQAHPSSWAPFTLVGDGR